MGNEMQFNASLHDKKFKRPLTKNKSTAKVELSKEQEEKLNKIIQEKLASGKVKK